jgi:HPt (histidine-containing phosphotransfer) domain-containing protein
MSDTPVLNPAAITRLCQLGGNPFAIKMIDLFISYCGEKVATARQAQVAGDLTAVANAAHPIKSSAGNVGALRVQELATRLEQLARAAQAAVPTPLAELEQAFAAACRVLEQRKAELVAPPA